MDILVLSISKYISVMNLNIRDDSFFIDLICFPLTDFCKIYFLTNSPTEQFFGEKF